MGIIFFCTFAFNNFFHSLEIIKTERHAICATTVHELRSFILDAATKWNLKHSKPSSCFVMRFTAKWPADATFFTTMMLDVQIFHILYRWKTRITVLKEMHIEKEMQSWNNTSKVSVEHPMAIVIWLWLMVPVFIHNWTNQPHKWSNYYITLGQNKTPIGECKATHENRLFIAFNSSFWWLIPSSGAVPTAHRYPTFP